jgi:signal transduction histidine kinase
VSRVGTEVQIEVSGTEHEAALRVLDRGPGIEPELRERIFDAFYSGTARGTGLGLAIVKRIADSHHGRVEINERDGGGSVFAWIVPRDFITASMLGPSEPTGELPAGLPTIPPPS